MEAKGLCKDCIFLSQDWTVFEDGKTGQLLRELDWMCDICQTFKRVDGYCDFWEPK